MSNKLLKLRIMNAFIIFAILAVVAFVVFALVFMYRLRTYEKPLEQETPEVYPYKYQTPFDDKLIELGVKEKWDANWDAQLKNGWKLSVDFEELNFEDFIFRSLVWYSTKEGYYFWQSISKK